MLLVLAFIVYRVHVYDLRMLQAILLLLRTLIVGANLVYI